MQTKIIERYFFFGLLLGTLAFTFLIFRPFWIILVLGISFSIVLYPIHKGFQKIKLPNAISAFLTVLIFTIALGGPLLGIGLVIFDQSENAYYGVVKDGNTEKFVSSIDKAVNKILPKGVVFDTNQKAAELISHVANNVASMFSSIISAFFSFLLMLLLMFYFLKDGTQLKKAIIVFSPLGDESDKKIIERLTQAINGVLKGTLLIALVQGLLLGFGFWLFGIPNSALWGTIAAVTSLIPTFGTALISVPAIIFLFTTGETTSAIGLLIWAIVLVGLIDNFLGPLVIGRNVRLPSILILFSVIGGISLLGPIGILVGPLTISLLYSLVSIYQNEFKQNTASQK